MAEDALPEDEPSEAEPPEAEHAVAEDAVAEDALPEDEPSEAEHAVAEDAVAEDALPEDEPSVEAHAAVEAATAVNSMPLATEPPEAAIEHILRLEFTQYFDAHPSVKGLSGARAEPAVDPTGAVGSSQGVGQHDLVDARRSPDPEGLSSVAPDEEPAPPSQSPRGDDDFFLKRGRR